jgi:hypothetical protein
MTLIDKLDKKALSELLGKCWMTHDGMWFYNCFLECGIVTANKVNKAAMRSLAPIEIARVKKAIAMEKVSTFEDIKQFIASVAGVFVPDFMNVSFTFPEQNIMHWEFNEKGCFAYNGMRMINALDGYECGPMYRIERWFDSMNIKYDIEPKTEKCVMLVKNRCAGNIRFHL